MVLVAALLLAQQRVKIPPTVTAASVRHEIERDYRLIAEEERHKKFNLAEKLTTADFQYQDEDKKTFDRTEALTLSKKTFQFFNDINTERRITFFQWLRPLGQAIVVTETSFTGKTIDKQRKKHVFRQQLRSTETWIYTPEGLRIQSTAAVKRDATLDGRPLLVRNGRFVFAPGRTRT